jgi:hypothetical protein
MNDQLVLNSASEFTESKVVGGVPMDAVFGGVQPHPVAYRCSDRIYAKTRWLLFHIFEGLGIERRCVERDFMINQLPNSQKNKFFFVHIIQYLSKTTYYRPIHRRINS